MVQKSEHVEPVDSLEEGDRVEQPPESFWTELLRTLGIAVVLAMGIRTFIAEARWIPSESMIPTLEVNDRLIVEKVGYYFHEPDRGDVVVFQPTDALKRNNYREAFIKRIIGLPGEEVVVRNGRVFVNGEALSEDYIEEAPLYTYGPKSVPEGQYFVLGDNRNASYDSHAWGFVPRENIIGRAAVRFWPLGRLGGLESSGNRPLLNDDSLQPTAGR
ncbi:signal peptidase I [Rubidibacter lacunae KORDI 51-2]|uniref:Signal peptidase I n=1 Tax=Rubidibacter lacunae KORDI 51-2 TaxID=582515 RepID=U5DIR0_9CHRO|nr:signal peptidase I [Rubidibacter lacunae]ERN41556.1 signal peptidase I [Rubidibacter lacunae KORDI 51-2]